MKNIWILNHYIIPPSIEDGHRHVKFANQLVRRGYKPVLMYSSYIHRLKFNIIEGPEKYKINEIDNIKYIGFKTRSYKGNKLGRVMNMMDYFIAILKSTNITKNKVNKPDIIMASSVHPLTCVAGIMISKKLNIPCIVEIRDLWPLTLIEFGKVRRNSLIARVMFLGERWIYKNADKIIFTMEGGIDYIKEQCWDDVVDLKKVYHINNGIDLEKFNTQRKVYEYKDSDLDDNNTFKIIYSGSLGEANAPKIIIETAKQLIGYDQLKVIIFGDGSQKKILEEYCKNNNLSNVVFKGRVDKKYIPNILSKGDLNIFTGKHINLYKYGISLNKMFDYFASGKPTLSNIECGYNIIKKYKCGITVEGGSIEALTEGILKFYNMTKEEYNIYCKNALLAAEDFDFRVLTDKLEAVILED